MNDPTANLVRAFEIRVGDRIVVPVDYGLRVDEIEELGGDEMGCAVFKFIQNGMSGRTTYSVPYAALVKRI